MNDKLKDIDASPLKSAREELDDLRRIFREAVDAFASRVDAEIVHLRDATAAEAAKKRKLSKKQIADARDMISLVRKLDLKPAKGRRRDLRKIELLVEDLRQFVESW